ncbi:hypothetical protein WNY51_18090 [Pseudocolwellia sp. AS88]|nr:hypothetical protein [Pseudocolwellia sp. AS88]MDO7085535.1 hypothetical protein [Pseudocolwellia sp. AS88]
MRVDTAEKDEFGENQCRTISEAKVAKYRTNKESRTIRKRISKNNTIN